MTLVQRLIILVVLALVPALAGVSYSLALLRDVRLHEEQTDARQLVNLVDTQHQHLHDTLSLVLSAIAIEAPSATERADVCATLLAQLRAPGYRWLDVLVLDATGIVRCSTVAGTRDADRSGEPEVIAAAGGNGMVVGPLARQAFRDEASLQAALPWRGPEGAHGIVLARVSPRLFLAPLISDLLDQDSAIIIADPAGHILYTVPERAADAAQALPPDLAATVRRNHAEATRGLWLDGTERIVATGPVTGPLGGAQGNQVAIIAGVANAAALDDIAWLTRNISSALGLTMLATMAAAYWGGIQFIRRPLGVLTQTALRWRDGDQSARVRLPGRSEIAALGRVFDEMADATERSERQIREAADLLNALIESSADAIFVKDHDGRYVLTNSAFARIFGHDRDALVGMRDADVLGPELGQRVHDIHTNILTTRQPYVCDLTFPPKGDGQADPRVLQTIYAPIRAPDGSVVAVAGIARDVTDERRAASELRAAKDRAEAADESKTRFLAAASHDLRQPVQAAILFASLIVEHASDAMRKPAEQLRLVLDDLRVMLDSLFDVSRYDTQSMQPEIVAFPLQPLIDQAVATVADAARAKGLTLQARATPGWVLSDHALLSRMLGNIVQNAVRYTEMGSITITVVPHEHMLRIEVRDTGPGIAAEDLTRIWEEFSQLHNPERDRRQGLGLGLAIVRRLSRLLNHPVHVASAPGLGTCFTIELPRAEPAIHTHTSDTTAPAPPAMAGTRVAVVVEDDPPLLSVLRMILEDHGWAVIDVADTEEALTRLEAGTTSPDVILTDYRLRDGKLGTGAITAIRTYIGRAIPAIILTGDISSTTADSHGPLGDAERLGDVAVLRKPVAAAELAAALNRAMAATAG